MKNKYFDLKLDNIHKQNISIIDIICLFLVLLPVYYIIIFILPSTLKWSIFIILGLNFYGIFKILYKTKFNFNNYELEFLKNNCIVKKIVFKDIKKVFILNQVYLMIKDTRVNTVPATLKVFSNRSI